MLRSLKILIGLFLVFSALTYAFHAEGIQDTGLKKWEKMLKDYPIPKNSIELELRFSFPSEDLAKKDILFNNPRCIGKDSEENIYVTDDRENRVLKFDPSGNFLHQFGQRGQGPGDFITPHEFFITKEDILIIGETGNMRFQFFDKDGKYIKNFKIFKGYNSWVVGNNGLIFALPRIRKESDHLIEVLNQEGVVLSAFGEPLNFKYDIAIYNDAKMDINKNGELYVAFWCLPIVRKYSQKGELLAEFRIDHPLMEVAEDHNKKNQSLIAQGKRVTYKPAIISIRASETGFYVFRIYPRIEILEFDNNGKKIAHYWKDAYPYTAENFIVCNDGKEDLFYILHDYPEAQIDVFGQKNKLKRKRRKNFIGRLYDSCFTCSPIFAKNPTCLTISFFA